MIIHPILETSVVATAVASAVVKALIINDTPAEIVPTLICPRAAAPVDPGDCLVKIMIELAVTDVVAIVAVPDTSVTFPNELAPAVVVDATLELIILFPAVPKTKFPLVAVIAPRVAVNVVEAVNEPVTAVLPVVLPILTAPVPPVPIVVTPAPDALINAVPIAVCAAKVVNPVTFKVVPTSKLVVVEIDPGAVKAEGTDKVTVFPALVAVI